MYKSEAVIKYLEAGFAVIPLWPDKRKNPHLKDVNQYLKTLPTKKDWKRWLNRWPRCNLGLITGYWKNLVALDFDTETEYEFWAAQVGTAAGQTWTVRTGRGYHVWFQLESEPGKSRLFFHPAGHEVLLRAKGGYCIVPPSIHHSGKPYKTVHNVVPLLVESVPLPGWNTKELVTKQSSGTASLSPKLSARIEEMIAPIGKPNRRGASKAHCPFHDDKSPSAWVNIEQQRFGCNACFPDRWWDAVNVYAMLKGIENDEAFKQLKAN